MIEINNLTTSSVNEEFLKKVAKTVLKDENKRKDLSIVLAGAGRIRKLNKKYRGKNRVTDVLAFPGQVSKKEKFFSFPEETKELEEIVICLPVIKKNAKRYGVSFEKELGRVLIHGILHLLGYNHEKSERESGRMKEKEEYYLSQI